MDGELEEFVVRQAVVADAPSIARVHIAAWRHAASDAAQADYLASLDQSERAEYWRGVLESRHATTWIAASDRRVLGFASLGDSRDEDAGRRTLELYAIYLDPEVWGRGVARNLMRTLLDDVPAGSPLTLWVQADNVRARQFYRRHGFTSDATERSIDIGGIAVLEVRYRRG